MGTVKSWRVLKTAGINAGGSHRQQGDYVPDAGNWPTLRSCLATKYLEEVWVDEEVVKQNQAEIAEREKPKGKKVTKKSSKKVRRVKKSSAKKEEESDEPRELTEQSV